MESKIPLYGFNNLTKTLSFNIYDICYAESKEEQRDYISYIDEQYNSERLTKVLCEVVDIIGAHVLNISKQDYEPQGASVNVLITEGKVAKERMDSSCNGGTLGNKIFSIERKEKDKEHTNSTPDDINDREDQSQSCGSSLNVHLDKSHVTVHTFPESHPNNSISTFRVDIDVSSCGEISPLSALDYLIRSFDSDIITLDYRVRGFTRDKNGQKHYIDHKINSIQNYISETVLKNYDAMDVNVYQSNFFHTKMLIKEIKLQEYLFNKDARELSPNKRLEIINNLRKEMIEIFSGMNIYE